MSTGKQSKKDKRSSTTRGCSRSRSKWEEKASINKKTGLSMLAASIDI